MKSQPTHSIAIRTPRTRIVSWLAFAVMSSALLGCSTVPDWSQREAREFDVTILYESGREPRSVTLPTTTDDLLILRLDAADLQESYTESERRLKVPDGAGSVAIRCRYRVFRGHSPDGSPLPWPRARDLFPGANRIVDHGTEASVETPEE